MSLTMDDSSRRVFLEADAVMVYGYSHCNNQIIPNAIRADRLGTPVISLGQVAPPQQNDDCYQIRYEDSKPSRQMKAALVNVVAANYIAKKNSSPEDQEPLTRIVFCIDTNFSIDGTAVPKFEIENIISKTKEVSTVEGRFKLNSFFTNKELRRAIKLCLDPSLPKEFRKIAIETFHFVKVNLQDGNRVLNLEPVNPMNMIIWEEFCEARASGGEAESTMPRDPNPWRDQVWELENRLDLGK